MFSMWHLIGLGFLFLLIVAVLNRKAFSRLMDTGSAQVGKGARWAWSRDPVAILQDKIDKSAEQIAEATHGLEDYRGKVEGIKRRVQDGTKMCANLDAQIKLALKGNNETRAAQYAVQLQREQEHLEVSKQQLQSYETGYQNNLKKVKTARTEIITARENAQRMGAELRMSQADKELATLAQNFNVKTNHVDGLGEITDEIQKQIDANRAVSTVQSDIGADGLDEINEREQVQKEKATAILDKYKADMAKK